MNICLIKHLRTYSPNKMECVYWVTARSFSYSPIHSLPQYFCIPISPFLKNIKPLTPDVCMTPTFPIFMMELKVVSSERPSLPVWTKSAFSHFLVHYCLLFSPCIYQNYNYIVVSYTFICHIWFLLYMYINKYIYKNKNMYFYLHKFILLGFHNGSVVKNLPAVQETVDADLIPESGTSPGGENSKLLQYSCLENPVDRGAWWIIVHRIMRSMTWLSNWHTYTHIIFYIYEQICWHKHFILPSKCNPFCPWSSPGKNTRVRCHAFLQGIFPTQGSNPGLLHLLLWQVDSLPLAPLKKPMCNFVPYIFLNLLFPLEGKLT